MQVFSKIYKDYIEFAHKIFKTTGILKNFIKHPFVRNFWSNGYAMRKTVHFGHFMQMSGHDDCVNARVKSLHLRMRKCRCKGGHDMRKIWNCMIHCGDALFQIFVIMATFCVFCQFHALHCVYALVSWPLLHIRTLLMQCIAYTHSKYAFIMATFCIS